MGKYNVDVEELKVAGNKLETVHTELERASSKINKAYYAIKDMESAQTKQCAYDIVRQGKAYDAQWENINHIRAELLNICTILQTTENNAKKILDEAYELPDCMIVPPSWDRKEEENEYLELTEDVIQAMLGKSCFTGTVISSAWKLSEESEALNRIKAVNTIVKSGTKAYIKSKDIIEEGIKKTKFADRFIDEISDSISDFTVKDCGTALQPVEKTRCLTEWVGVLLDGGFNFVDNIKEYEGDMSNARLYEETVVETALSFGVDMVRDAAFTAVLLPVLGPVTPVAVAGLGVVTDFVMDKASEWIFGNEDGWVENVSDGIIDFAHDFSNSVQNVQNGIKNIIGKGISSMGKRLTTAWAT